MFTRLHAAQLGRHRRCHADRSPSSARRRWKAYVNCGWGTGGSGHAQLRPHVRTHHRQRRAASDRAPFTFDRFRTGRLIDGRLKLRWLTDRPAPCCSSLVPIAVRVEIEFHGGGEAHIARPADPSQLDVHSGRRFCSTAPIKGHAPNAGCTRLPALVQRAARYGDDRITATYRGSEPRPALDKDGA